jgi:hypothetical protein
MLAFLSSKLGAVEINTPSTGSAANRCCSSGGRRRRRLRSGSREEPRQNHAHAAAVKLGEMRPLAQTPRVAPAGSDPVRLPATLQKDVAVLAGFYPHWRIADGLARGRSSSAPSWLSTTSTKSEAPRRRALRR